jgi:hypothetical protein
MKEKTGSNKMALGFAWFRAEDWDELRRASVDSQHMEERYEDWERMAASKLEELRQRGVRVEKILVDLQELLQWCQAHNVHLDAAARSRFAAEKVRDLFSKERS